MALAEPSLSLDWWNGTRLTLLSEPLARVVTPLSTSMRYQTLVPLMRSEEITTGSGSGNLLIIDDLAITLQTEPIYNIF